MKASLPSSQCACGLIDVHTHFVPSAFPAYAKLRPQFVLPPNEIVRQLASALSGTCPGNVATVGNPATPLLERRFAESCLSCRCGSAHRK